jgi:dephospho-CoA kinase
MRGGDSAIKRRRRTVSGRIASRSQDPNSSVPFLVGIGGQTGSGKSLVARCFARRGAEVIDADRIGWGLLAQPGSIHTRVVRAFGKRILDDQGEIDRHRLGTIVFADRKAMAKLNRIVHPALLAELDRRVRAPIPHAPGSGMDGRIRIIDAALLFFWGWHKRVDLAVLVTASLKSKLARLAKNGIPRTRGIQRLRSQLQEVRMRRLADAVIRNDGTIADLNRQCRELWQTIEERAARKR